MNDFDRMFNKVAKEQNYADAKRAANTSMLTIQDYLRSCKNPNGETKVLKQLSEIFEELSPFWANDFQKLEQQKEKIYRTSLAKEVNLYDDILREADGIDNDNATTIALHVYLANKIAHAYQAKQNNLISELLERKKFHIIRTMKIFLIYPTYFAHIFLYQIY